MKSLSKMIKRLIFRNIVEINLKSKTIEIDIESDRDQKDLFKQNYAGTSKSALRKLCQQNDIKVISPQRMGKDLNIKSALLKERETLQICFPETMKGVEHMYRMHVAKEIRKYISKIMKILKVGQPCIT